VRQNIGLVKKNIGIGENGMTRNIFVLPKIFLKSLKLKKNLEIEEGTNKYILEETDEVAI